MEWITVDWLIVVAVVVAAVLIVIQIVKLGALLKRWATAKDYNSFVHVTYTQNVKETPTMILRIQNGYIQQYNACLKRCRFLSLFFKEMACFGDSPVKIVDTNP